MTRFFTDEEIRDATYADVGLLGLNEVKEIITILHASLYGDCRHCRHCRCHCQCTPPESESDDELYKLCGSQAPIVGAHMDAQSHNPPDALSNTSSATQVDGRPADQPQLSTVEQGDTANTFGAHHHEAGSGGDAMSSDDKDDDGKDDNEDHKGVDDDEEEKEVLESGSGNKFSWADEVEASNGGTHEWDVGDIPSAPWQTVTRKKRW